MLSQDRKYIAFTLYPGITPLDLFGPLSVLRDLKLRTPYRTCVVGKRLEPVATESRLEIMPTATFEDVTSPFAVFVPGGPGAVKAILDGALLNYVRSTARTAEIVGSTGSGALILAASGLLDGRRVATHWAYRERLERHGARYVPNRWVEDGKFMTAAGGSAGIDMTLFLVARLAGESTAKLAQLFLEYDPQPPFGRVTQREDDGHIGRVIGAQVPEDTLGKSERSLT